MTEVYAIKKQTTQTFVGNKRMPATVLAWPETIVTQLKTEDKDGYSSLQVALGRKRKSPSKPVLGHLKASKLAHQPRWLKEITLNVETQPALGETLDLLSLLSVGDTVNASAISKGKGFSGVVKRHNFAGGPKTHGQSDRHRAPGSIGRGTTPGRVLPGKKMAGRMGGETMTVTNLKVLSIDAEAKTLTISGLVPGANQSLVKLTITKKSANQNG